MEKTSLEKYMDEEITEEEFLDCRNVSIEENRREIEETNKKIAKEYDEMNIRFAIVKVLLILRDSIQ